MPADTVVAERKRLRDPPSRLEDDRQIQPVIEGVDPAVEKSLGIDSSLHLRLTVTDSNSVLDAIVPKVLPHLASGCFGWGSTLPSALFQTRWPRPHGALEPVLWSR